MGLDFFDSDREVEKAIGKKIQTIFLTYGEKTFRDYERKIIEHLLSGPPKILATGGGAFMDTDIRAHIIHNGISVWIKADIETLVERTKGNNDRPLLNQKNEREVIEHLILERYPIYSKADITITTQIEPVAKTVKRLLSALQKGTH